jgi:SAM-dependent methyltransferase
MELPDPILLKKKYNDNFQCDENLWASDSIPKANKVVKKVLNHIFNQRNTFFINRKLKLLDVGSALGTYTNVFNLLGFHSFGIDISDVAVSKAHEMYPFCSFICMDGFNPVFSEKFDLIFCKGFSGANTHDIQFVLNWINKYIEILEPNGYLVFSYSTNHTGKENYDETVNWSKKEISFFIEKVNLHFHSMFYFYYYNFVSIIYSQLLRLFNSNKKLSFYIIFQKQNG